MKPATTEWVEKAEWDFLSAQRECRRRRLPNCDPICFLSPHCAEKYLKALLVEADAQFPKSHNLIALLKLVLPLHPRLELLRAQLTALNLYAVELRYPGDTAPEDEANAAFANRRKVRKEIRGILGLDQPPTAQLQLIKERPTRYRLERRRKQGG
jgi:HEPN domain-containing protein